MLRAGRRRKAVAREGGRREIGKERLGEPRQLVLPAPAATSSAPGRREGGGGRMEIPVAVGTYPAAPRSIASR